MIKTELRNKQKINKGGIIYERSRNDREKGDF